MTIEKSETVRLSNNEAKAIQLVERICDSIAREASDPNLIDTAYQLNMALLNFNDFWEEEI